MRALAVPGGIDAYWPGAPGSLPAPFFLPGDRVCQTDPVPQRICARTPRIKPVDVREGMLRLTAPTGCRGIRIDCDYEDVLLVRAASAAAAIIGRTSSIGTAAEAIEDGNADNRGSGSEIRRRAGCRREAERYITVRPTRELPCAITVR